MLVLEPSKMPYFDFVSSYIAMKIVQVCGHFQRDFGNFDAIQETIYHGE